MAGALLQTVTFRDAKGNTSTSRYYVSSGGTQATQFTASNAIRVALIALSNAAQNSAHGPVNQNSGPVVYGTNSEFATVEDKATFTFQTASGSIHRFSVPAPLSSIFLADGETIDNSNTAVVAYVSAMVANAFSRDGDAITFGANGIRQRRKLHRRANIFTKDPTLTQPEE